MELDCLLIFIAFLSFLGKNSSISCLLRKLGLCIARGGPRDLFLLRGHMLDSNYHVLAHMTHSVMCTGLHVTLVHVIYLGSRVA